MISVSKYAIQSLILDKSSNDIGAIAYALTCLGNRVEFDIYTVI